MTDAILLGSKRQILQWLMARLHSGEDPKEVLFDLLLHLDGEALVEEDASARAGRKMACR
jgi:hypothetical protein